MRHFATFALVLFVFGLVGCQSQGVDGGSKYSLGEREIHPPNQVRMDNPYDFPVKISWQRDKEMVLGPHSQTYIIFEGELKPGQVRINKMHPTDPKLLGDSLRYLPKTSGLIGGFTIYRVM